MGDTGSAGLKVGLGLGERDDELLVTDGVLSSLTLGTQSWIWSCCFGNECGGKELKRAMGCGCECTDVGAARGTVESAGLPNGDVGGVRFTPGALASSMVPPRVWLREPGPGLPRRKEGTKVIASSESRSRSESRSGKYESSVASRGEPQGARGECGQGTEFGRAEG